MSRILIKDIIGSFADDDKKGEKIYNAIQDKIKNAIKEQSENNKELVLDFEGIELVNTAFLNNAIGRLFDSNSFDLSEHPVKVAHMNENMRDLLLETIKVARSMYQ